MPDGSYYDYQGYYFDSQGFDANGGFYDKVTGEYVDPREFEEEDNQEFADYYDELCGSSSDEDDDEDNGDGDDKDGGSDDEDENYNIPDDEANKGIRREHCLPALKWLQEQPKDKMMVVKILNLPRRATEAMILKMLNKKIKDFKHDKFVLEMDNQHKNCNIGVSWVSSNDHYSLGQLVKLHYSVSIILLIL